MAPSTRNVFLPSFLFPVCILSLIISAGVLGLSFVTYGVLSRWYNAGASVFTILFFGVLFFLTWRQRVSAEPEMITVNLETPSTPDLKYPIQASPTQAETSPASSDYHVFHQMATILSLSFLTIIYLISLGVMMDITRRGTAGAPSANPAESMTYHWNWKCQMAQTILVGSEALTLAFVLATCIVGRSRMSTIHAQERENVEYGFDRSEKHI